MSCMCATPSPDAMSQYLKPRITSSSTRSHYRVVRIDPSSSSLDMFSSHSSRWTRHQLDPGFTRGFDLCRRHFVYLRGVLYSIASSGDQLLCIHLNTATVQSRSFQLPDSDNKSQACLGVSMETLCYFYRHDDWWVQYVSCLVLWW